MEQNPVKSTQPEILKKSGSRSVIGQQNTVSNLIDTVFAGETAGIEHNRYHIDLNGGIPIRANIPLKIKKKILNGQYLDLKCLLRLNCLIESECRCQYHYALSQWRLYRHPLPAF